MSVSSLSVWEWRGAQRAFSTCQNKDRQVENTEILTSSDTKKKEFDYNKHEEATLEVPFPSINGLSRFYNLNEEMFIYSQTQKRENIGPSATTQQHDLRG